MSPIVSYTTQLMLLFIFVFSPQVCLGSQEEKSETAALIVPSLMDSIRFENEIRYCGIPIPLERRDVKERLEKEMLLALWHRPQVILWIKRSTKYFPHIEKILKKQGLPLDLKYVPIVESALKPHASSSKGAVGFWQFLRSTGKRYGLRIDGQVDERRNLFKSTRAACGYIKELEAGFGSYLLSLAAYNMGEYGLKGEMEIQKNTDFFSLYLPLETQRYLFKIICAKLILENPELYGFNLKTSDLYPRFSFDQVNVKINANLPISLVANAADISFKTLKEYNPEIRGYFLNKGRISLLLPKGKAKGFKKRFESDYKKWKKMVKTKFHVIKKGESLTSIADTHKMSLLLLLKLNDLSVKSMIHLGDRLVIE